MPGGALYHCWTHNLATAILSDWLARILHLDRDTCYTAGLLHDIGRLALLRSFPDKYDRILKLEPPADFDLTWVGVPKDWPHLLTGFAAHWNKNTNFAAWFDQWFLNLFPREKPFVFNGGGYLTLSFIPTLGTMILGLLAFRQTSLKLI